MGTVSVLRSRSQAGGEAHGGGVAQLVLGGDGQKSWALA